MKTKTVLTTLTAAGLIAGHAGAATLAFDDFSTYTTGGINGQDGGGALLGFGSTTWSANSGNSPSSDLIVGDTLTVTGDSFRTYRAFGTQPLATTGIVYIRTNLTLGNSGFVALELATTLNSDANSVRIANSGAGFRVDVKGSGGSSSAQFGSDGAVNHEYLIELNLHTKAGQVWFNPATAGFDGTGGLSFTASSGFELNGIQTAAFSGSGQLIVLDDITIGTTLDSVGINVVPEPSSLTAGLIGLGGLALRRRRRNA